MELREEIDDTIPNGETFPDFIGTNGEANGVDAGRLIRKMLPDFPRNGLALPANGESRKNLFEMAWYCDPASWDVVSEWSYEAIMKMREPTYQGWLIQMSPTSLTRLLECC